MGPDGTELNLDGISKPELEKIPEARAKELTELSMNICKLSTLESLPSLPSLFKLSLNDNNLTSITGLAEKCPTLLELYLSGNKKISTLDQLDEISKIKSLLKIEIEGCGVQDTEGENYRDKIFKKFPHLQVVDSFNEKGEEMPDDDDEDEDDEEVADRNSIIKTQRNHSQARINIEL